MKVVKRDGRIVKLNQNKIYDAVCKAMSAVGDVDEDFANEVTETVSSKFSGKGQVSVEDIQDEVEDVLISSGRTKLAKAYMLYRVKRAEVRGFKDSLGIDDDLKFGVNALSLLERRYLKRFDGKRETPSQMFKRVSKAVASPEKRYGNNPDYWSKVFYNLMSNQLFLANTPCLANGGNKNLNYLFACYAFSVGDSIEEIFQTVKDSAIVQKTGGGMGLYLSDLRPAGSTVKTTEGIASGPIDFMRAFDVTSDVIKQGGIRRGGNMGLLLVSHPDIYDFVTSKNSEGKLSNFNISVALTDEFINAVKNNEMFPLKDPATGAVVKRVNACELMRFIAESTWLNGEPGIVFWDTCQDSNPIPSQGILIKNLCGEQDLVDSEACCLGSINLSKFVDDGKIVYPSLRKVVHHSVRFLDDVIDASDYPLEKIENIVKSNRKIGLGVMGFANMLFQLGIAYDSEEGLKVAEDVMSFISSEAKKASAKLADERGEFLSYSDSILTSPQRNATLTTIAPTGSISTIAETTSSIEPLFAVVYQKSNILNNETFLEVNDVFENIAKREGWYSSTLINKIVRNGGIVSGISEVPEKWRKVFVTALEISPDSHLRMQSVFQKFTDNSISKTVNMPYETSIEDVYNTILKAHDLGLKGFTAYRSGSRLKQVLELCSECEDDACPINLEE